MVAVGGLLLAAVLLALPFLWTGANEATRARRLLREAGSAVASQDAALARALVGEAREAVDVSLGRLGSVWTAPARLIPGFGRQVRTAHGLALAGEDAVDAVDATVDALEARPDEGWLIGPGRFDVDALRAAGERLAEAVPPAERAVAHVEATPGTWLAGPVASRRAAGLEEVRSALRGLRRGAAGLSVAPALLGADEPRRYYVAFANLSELRGTGGFLGYFSVLEVADGEVRLLDDQGRPTGEFPPPSGVEAPEWFDDAYGRFQATRLWQNLNLTTDFPTAGSLISQAVPTDVLGPVDGVIQIDPLGLRSVLELTGPVPVAPWPEPITPGNVSEVTQHDAYVRFDPDQGARVAFLGRLVEETFRALLQTEVDLGGSTLEGLGRATSGGHVQMWATRDGEQEALREAGLTWGVGRTSEATDVLSVVTENAGPNKIDWFLRRELGYEVSLDPSTREATGRLTSVLRNTAPSQGEPQYVIGPNADVGAGVNRLLLMLLRPPDDDLGGFWVAAQPEDVVRAREVELRSYQRFIDVPPEGVVQIEGEFVVPDGLREEDGELVYRLHVLRHPIAHPDEIGIVIRPPEGWEVSGRTRFEGPLTEDVVLEVRLSRSIVHRVVDTVFVGPFDLAKRLVGSLF